MCAQRADEHTHQELQPHFGPTAGRGCPRPEPRPPVPLQPRDFQPHPRGPQPSRFQGWVLSPQMPSPWRGGYPPLAPPQWQERSPLVPVEFLYRRLPGLFSRGVILRDSTSSSGSGSPPPDSPPSEVHNFGEDNTEGEVIPPPLPPLDEDISNVEDPVIPPPPDVLISAPQPETDLGGGCPPPKQGTSSLEKSVQPARQPFHGKTVKLYGNRCGLYGRFQVESLRHIPALYMQLPTDLVHVPDIDPIDRNCLKALVDFHEFNYLWPESIPDIVRQLVTADVLGDESFIAFIAAELKVPVGKLNSSHRRQDIKMVIRDRLKLSAISVDLKESSRVECLVCRSGFLVREVTDLVACCGRTFHRSCLRDLKSCPHCKEPWVSLRCAKCGVMCTSRYDRYLYKSHEQRSHSRMSCCGVDIHFNCRRSLHGCCPGCGESLDASLKPSPPDFLAFVYRRREMRRNEAKRRNIKK